MVRLGTALLLVGKGVGGLGIARMGGGGVGDACITLQLCIICLKVGGVGGLGTAQQNCIIHLSFGCVGGLGTAL